MSKPSLTIRLQVLAAVDAAPGGTIRARIQAVSRQTFVDQHDGKRYQFTWRTISTWCNFPNSHRTIGRFSAELSSTQNSSL